MIKFTSITGRVFYIAYTQLLGFEPTSQGLLLTYLIGTSLQTEYVTDDAETLAAVYDRYVALAGGLTPLS
jgi:hypothetical protein